MQNPRGRNIAKLCALMVVIGGLSAWGVSAGATGWVVVIGALIMVVMLHEWGHYVTARRSGMKVHSFFLGFGPRLWSITHRGIEYGIRAIPAGGFVKIAGMSWKAQIDPATEAHTYRQQSTPKKVLVASAGSIMHMLLAFLLVYGVLTVYGVPSNTALVVNGVIPGAPAAKARLSNGDQIVAVNGHPASQSRLLAAMQHDRAVRLTVVHDGNTTTHRVTPETLAPFGPAIGAQVSPLRQDENPIGAIGSATVDMWKTFYLTLDGFKSSFSPQGIVSLGSAAFSGPNPQQAGAGSHGTAASTHRQMESIVGIARTTADTFSRDPLYLVEVLVAANVSIGLLNMLPILPFDGGYVALAIYERLRSRRGAPRYRADANKQTPAVVVLGAVLTFMMLATVYLDATHPLHP